MGVLDGGRVRRLNGPYKLSDVLHADDPAGAARSLLDGADAGVPVESVTLLAPIDDQEVWAAGVTYKRSREAQERESAGAARFYDLVYNAERPELFFKAPARRVVGPGGPRPRPPRQPLDRARAGSRPHLIADNEDRRIHHRQRRELRATSRARTPSTCRRPSFTTAPAPSARRSRWPPTCRRPTASASA